MKVKVILTSKERSHSLPRHRQIERDCVSLLHAEGLEDVRERTDLAEELGVRHGAALSGLVCFPDNGSLKILHVQLLVFNVSRFDCLDGPGQWINHPRTGANTNLVGVLECPSVDTVVRGVQTTLGEPDNVASLEPACTDGLERSVPMEGVSRDLQRRWR
jgi:hypothetical protein